MRIVGPLALLVSAVGLAACTTAAPSPARKTSPSTPTLPSTTSTSAAPSTTPVPTAPPTTVAPVGSIGPVFVEPGAGIQPIDTFLGSASSSLTMTMYELIDPAAEQILGQDAARGVRVQVLLDSALESARNQPARAYLVAHGVSVVMAPSSRITHQKTVCVDRRACLIMSLNLVAEDYASTRDVAVEDTDPADVQAIESTFAADFAGTTAPATSDGDHLVWSPGSQDAILGVINGAQKTLAVENEEMDSTAVTDALSAAARRGVDVEVCMTADSEYTGALDQIVAAGGHVHLYPDEDGDLYIHEKLVLADAGTSGAHAVVGSINFSTSSMEYNRELDISLDMGDAASPMAALEAAFQSDFNGAPAL